MYSPMDIDGQNYYLKPMNCPFHIQIYKSKMRSYRDLPLRWAELGTVYRYERSGTLHGLLRVRGFTQDDAHIFCTPDQIEDEILRVLDFSLSILADFGFTDNKIELSVRDPKNPDKYCGADDRWCQAEASLVKALETRGLAYERMEGEAVFYGPKIDIKVKDALGRFWQCTTIQFDFNMSERFDMTFIGEDGKEHRPYMVHRALLGSLERFFGILIEHYNGNFPLWLAPVQVEIIPIAERHDDYARKLVAGVDGPGPPGPGRPAPGEAQLQDPRGRDGRRSRSSSSSATRKPRPGPPRSASTARATRGPWSSPNFWTRSNRSTTDGR